MISLASVLQGYIIPIFSSALSLSNTKWYRRIVATACSLSKSCKMLCPLVRYLKGEARGRIIEHISTHTGVVFEVFRTRMSMKNYLATFTIDANEYNKLIDVLICLTANFNHSIVCTY